MSSIILKYMLSVLFVPCIYVCLYVCVCVFFLYWRLFTVQYIGCYLIKILKFFWPTYIKLWLVNNSGIMKLYS